VLEQARGGPLRAPLVIAVVATIDPQHAKIPEIEQVLSAGAAVQNMLLAAHAQGYGGKWLTGANAYDEQVRQALGLATDHRLVAFLYLGSADGEPPTVPHADARQHAVEWSG